MKGKESAEKSAGGEYHRLIIVISTSKLQPNWSPTEAGIAVTMQRCIFTVIIL
jgi:hypothetical protein